MISDKLFDTLFLYVLYTSIKGKGNPKDVSLNYILGPDNFRHVFFHIDSFCGSLLCSDKFLPLIYLNEIG